MATGARNSAAPFCTFFLDSPNPALATSDRLETIVERRGLLLSRRGLLKFFASHSLASILGSAVVGCAAVAGKRLQFQRVPTSLDDAVHVPPGYSAKPFFAWGDPISDGPAFKLDASNTAAEQALQAGMHHDGMNFFPLPLGSKNGQRGILAINHEYLEQRLLYPDGMATWSAEKVAKALHGVGVSVIEVEKSANNWRVVRPSAFARRIHARTPTRLSGPARGADSMKTAADRDGTTVIGTFANCAGGLTPWGTYLTCEENFQNWFVKPSGALTTNERRYSLRKTNGHRWHEFDARFDVDQHPNEFNRFGWIVEIDPYDPTAQPVKRTALGRFAHESAYYHIAKDGRVVIYSGDDTAFEFIYKFVTRDAFNPNQREANRDLLDHGTLYVAHFAEDGTGTWKPLVFGQNGLASENGFDHQADVVIHTKAAAATVGGTPMDRPEWITVHPHTGEVYVSLTSNTQRGNDAKPLADAANPRAKNHYGHILRWREANGDAASTQFAWDIFALAGDPASVDPAQRGDIRGDAFACPDTLSFGPDGTLWICTDTGTPGKNAYANFGNNALLAADTQTGEVRRFLTGPRGCEIAGLTITPDGKTAFLNIQHPGDGFHGAGTAYGSHWPSGDAAARPRSATIVITKDDGGVIGS